MKRSDKILSALITMAMTLAFVSVAVFISLHYNSWFVDQDIPRQLTASSSDAHGSTVTLNMDQSGLTSGISDKALDELNIYDFPQG